MHNPVENEKLCVFLIEKALQKLPSGKEQILGILDLRGFSAENTDFKFLASLETLRKEYLTEETLPANFRE